MIHANVVTIVILCARSNLRDIKVGDYSHTHFQVEEDDVDSPETSFTGEII